MKKLLAILLALVLVLAACGGSGSSAEKGSKENPVKIGFVGENNEVWEYVKGELEKENIYVELVSFTEYTQPNEALLSGDIDLNSFQHQAFLDNFNAEKGSDLQTIGKTVLAPLGIYSEKIKNVSEIKERDRIAIPNDPSNGSRALYLLKDAGLIKVTGKVGDSITLNDITENPLNLEIVELEASQTARALDDLTASVINNGMATDAGLVPTKDAILLENPGSDSPFINIIVATNENKDNELFKKIVEVYQQDGTKAKIEEVSKGSQVPAWD